MNDAKDIVKYVINWMCKGYCPNYRICQLIKRTPNHRQMVICLDNMVMFNTGHYPKEHEVHPQE